jgi:signal transduction histidine kinase
MPLNVYYLDDEQALCDVFRDTYSSDDVHVLTFTDPAALIQQAKNSPPDLAFFDYCLPSTTGDKVAQALDPNIPKVLVTGDTGVVSDYPFLKIIYKPWDDQDVIQILNTEMNKRNRSIVDDKLPEIIASEKAAALDVGVGHLVHQINTPLAVIKMRAHQISVLLEKESVAGNIKEDISRLSAIIESMVDEMTSSLREMRESVKIDTTEVFQACDIRDSLEIASHIVKQRTKQIILDLNGLDSAVKVMCKPKQLVQIIMNVLMHLVSISGTGRLNNKIVIASEMTDGKVFIRMSTDGIALNGEGKDETSYDPLYLFKGERKTRGLDRAIAEKLTKANRGTLDVSTTEEKRVVVLQLISAQEQIKKAR